MSSFAAAPTSLAVKMHATGAEGAALGAAMKIYEKELYMFHELDGFADGLCFRVPKVYAMFKDLTEFCPDYAKPGVKYFNLVMVSPRAGLASVLPPAPTF